jgi:fumarate hydratase class II
MNLQTVDFYKTGKTIREVAREQTALSEEELDRRPRREKMTEA